MRTTLVLDVGNGHIFGGLFEDGSLTVRFRKASRRSTSSDELGLFLRAVLREHGKDPGAVQQIVFCSVVPELVYSLRSCCRKYFRIDPFTLQAGAKTGLKIGYRHPLEVGADRIANAVGALQLHPQRNLIIVDLGTTTTVDAIAADRHFLGGIILPGVRVGMESLERSTARLPTVEISPPPGVIGRSTVECIQSGIYYGNRALVRGLMREIRDQAFPNEPALTIGTGGFCRLFDHDQLFDVVLPDLVLTGLARALELNPDSSRPWSEAGDTAD
jgi:type III pantothenate kinase